MMARKAEIKKVLVFRHIPSEGLGTIEPFLRQAGVGIDFCCLDKNDAIPERPGDYDAVISMGGPMNANETDRYPFLLKEQKFLELVVRDKIPLLGICLGSQMIAGILGAKVFKGPGKEIGWFPIEFNDEARRDPVFRIVPEKQATVFHWHGDTFELPKGAALLASSAAYSHQAFRYGDCIYAFQFHIEITPEMVQNWVRVNEKELIDIKLISQVPVIVKNTSRYAEALKIFAGKIYQRLFDYWGIVLEPEKNGEETAQ